MILLRFLAKRQLKQIKNKRGRNHQYTITNNGQIIYSYIEAQEQDGLYPQRFRAAISTLIERGFISVIDEGGLMHRTTKYHVHLPNQVEPWRTWKK